MIIRSTIGLLLALGSCAREQPSLVNTSHLRHLTERISFQGDSVDIIRIYADAPKYDWVGAGDEGIACVDDAARAAVFYLTHAKLMQDRSSLDRARELLKFVLRMETDEGLFYNFIREDRSINTTGSTSLPSFGWWAGRGIWSLGLGYRVFLTSDPAFADVLSEAVERAFPHLDTLLNNYGHERVASGMRIPEWLLYGSGADATSELVLGLIEYESARPQQRVRTYIEKLCEGMMIMQDGDIGTFPHGAHRSWESRWHAWGNSQTQALATAGKLLKNDRMIASAKREAEGWYGRLLILGNQRERDFADSANHKEYEQIAYDIRPMAVGLLRLGEATGEDRYARMAGLAASWFFGNNTPGKPMYDFLTGRGYDGIRSGSEVNANSGAESTIEALLTVLEVEHSSAARQYLYCRKGTLRTTADALTRTITDKEGKVEGAIRIDLRQGQMQLIDREQAEAMEKDVTQ
ncbi:MAG: hypothetical protein A3G43_07990 [Ignavibacteria bacterium RIFCSPLOWO2_12_FULL_56_21]|nr:MAG: hypothetical protein A3G43_07990 [Ignavibacteria bacterium RIFCSPLOWO2_12_FULL_56_21]